MVDIDDTQRTTDDGQRQVWHKLPTGELKSGCSAGMDGILAEHLKHGLDSNLISHLTNIITVCFRSGIIPESIYCGILIPLLKKNYS